MPRRSLPPWAEELVLRTELFLLAPDVEGARLSEPELVDLCGALRPGRTVAEALFARLVDVFWAGGITSLLEAVATRYPARADEARALVVAFHAVSPSTGANRPA